jgi:thiamine biosynthesis lipoprotein
VQQIEFRAMGSQMLAVLDGDMAGADRLAQVPEWFERWEQRLSRFREDSELNGLNRRSGQPVRVSPVLWEVARLALQAAFQTEGLVTPAVLTALEAAGYDRSFDSLDPTRPLAAAPADLSASVGDWRAIECQPGSRSLRLPPGMRLDFGGIAKGWAADVAARRLQGFGPALVDAGGDISVSGPLADGQPWPIGIGDPLRRGRNLAVLAIRQGGVATSGRDYRRWQRDGVWQHHILDPRTGSPAETDVLSATVVGRSAAEAEMAAKAALILGSAGGLAWLEARPEFAGLLVLEDGRTAQSRRMNEYIWN